MTGIELRTSRASNWVQCRQRAGAATVGAPVLLDLAGADALTSALGLAGGKNSLGTRTAASTPLATVVLPSAGLAHGRIGVAMADVADNAVGLYEFGEVGDGQSADIILEALVRVHATSVRGAPLRLVQVASEGVYFGAGGPGAAYATLLEDGTTDNGLGPSADTNLRTVILHTEGKGEGAEAPLSITAIEDDEYTLALTDAWGTVTIEDADPITLTVPANATVPFPIGTQIVIAQLGAGVITVDPATDVVINSLASNVDLAGQFGAATLIKTGANEWLLYGDLA